MGRSNVFSLEQIYRKQVVGTWSNIPETFRYVNSLGGTSNVGYFGAGAYNPRPEGPIVDRVDFDNDTATAAPRSNLSSARYKCAGVGNKDYGYFGGGVTTSPSYDITITTVDRLDYSNDSADMVAKGPLANHHRANDNTVGNDDYGYWCGSVGKSYVDRIDYSSDTSTTVEKGSLTMNRAGAMGVGDASYGYICGGETPSRRSSIDRIDFSSDTSTAAPKGNLTNTVDNGAATGNASYGYVGGGSTPSPVSTVDRIDYSNDTATASPKGPLVRTNWLFSATGNTSYGYFGGGDPPSSPSPAGSSFVDRVDYSNDTPTASPKGNLSLSYRNTNSFSPREYALPSATPPVPATRTEQYPSPNPYHYGYWIGGDGGGSRYHRIDFSNDTGTAGVRGNLDRSYDRHAAVSSTNHAYVAGGGPWASTYVSRIDYADDTATGTPKGNLAPSGGSGYSSPAGVDNVNYGYICGGLPLSLVNRIDFSNDTAAAILKGPLTATRRYISATGNQSYGYVIAGTPPDFSSVDRIDYSNDTATATVKGNLPYTVYGHGATGNADYGYVTAGFNVAPGSNNWISSTSRIDYSNDTATAASKGPLSQPRRNKSTGNTSYGWSGGGSAATPSHHSGTSTIDRIDFSNDTATASVRGPLSGTRTNLYTASSLANAKPQTVTTTKVVDKGAHGYKTSTLGPAYGYTVGGLSYSLYQRVDYSNDTATASNQAHTSNPSGLSLSVGNNTHAYTWVSGGQGQFSSIVERYDYSDDTTNSTAKGNFPEEKSYLAGVVGNADYGYFMGGRNPGNSDTSDVLRVDYSNDTAAAAPKGPLTSARYHNNGGVGNQSYGYIGGDGLVSGSDIDRIDYSNDTATAVGKGYLTVQGGVKAATGNASYGYWGGGYPLKSTVSRLDYSNDSANTVNKGPLAVATIQFGSFGDTSYGYWAGGFPGPLSTVSRLDFSDDTTTAVAKGPLVQTVREHGGNSSRSNALTGSSTYIPRIRWVDSKPEADQGSPSPNPAYSNPSVGYIIGGEGQPGPTPYANPAQMIDFANDTATAVAKAGAAPPTNRLYYCCSVGNRDYAWTTMGAARDNVQRMDYANDTAQMVNRNTRPPSPQLGYNETAVGNLDYGYFNGGYILYTIPGCGSPQGATNLSHIIRMDYASDTSAPVLKSYNSNRAGMGGSCGNNNYGYWMGAANGICGGYNGSSTHVERTDYSNDTTNSSPKGPLASSVYSNRGQGNKDYGYSTGGASRSRVQRIDYANDTATTSSRGNLAQNFGSHQTTGSQSLGYTAGGSPGGTTVVNRIDYSNDTSTASPKGNLVYRAYHGGGASATENEIAHFPSPATDLPGTPEFKAPVQPPFPFPVQLPIPSPSMGYTLGSGTYVQRIDYTNDTATAPARGPLSASISYHSAVSSKTHGYTFGGSPSPSFRSIVQRVDYANDTATALTVANLAQPVYRTYSGMGNKTYGYQSGGQRPSNTGTTNIDRIEYANDTSTGLLKGNLTASRYLQTAVGNLSYGYVCGGSPPSTNNSRVQRVDYANDTATAPDKGPLHQGSRKLSSAGTADYGYVAGGTNPELSSTTRIDYSNDTATSVQKGSMTRTRRNFGGMSSPAYAYYTAGAMPYPTPALTSTDRLDYANDTATASPKGPLSASVSYFSAASPQDIAGALN